MIFVLFLLEFCRHNFSLKNGKKEEKKNKKKKSKDEKKKTRTVCKRFDDNDCFTEFFC